MKKLSIIMIFLLALVPVVSADVMMPDTHPVGKCVKIIDDAPQGYALVGWTGPPMGEGAYLIEKDVCLTKGYKFNSFKVLLIENDYLDSLGLENVDPGLKIGGNLLIVSSEDIEPWGGYVDDSDPTDEIDVEYKIRLDENGNFVPNENFLKKVKEVTKYNDGTPDNVWTNIGQNEPDPYAPGPVPSPDVLPPPQPMTFWEQIGCFFTNLFGGKC